MDRQIEISFSNQGEIHVFQENCYFYSAMCNVEQAHILLCDPIPNLFHIIVEYIFVSPQFKAF